MSIRSAVRGVLTSALHAVLNGLGSSQAVNPAEAEVRALLATAGDVWTFDEPQYEDAVGLFNALTFGDNAPKTSGLLGSAHYNLAGGSGEALTGDDATLPAIFSGANFSIYVWFKYTTGGVANVLRAESGGVSFLIVSINGTTCSFSVLDIGETVYAGSFTIPAGVAGTWTHCKIQRLNGDLYVTMQNANGYEGAGTEGAFGTNQNWSGGAGKLVAMGDAEDPCSISLDQMLYLETSDTETDVEGYWYNGGAGRLLAP